jgi:hypothetical protein
MADRVIRSDAHNCDSVPNGSSRSIAWAFSGATWPGQRVRTWAHSVGQPSSCRTIETFALPSTTCSGTALQCVQVNSAVTAVSVPSAEAHGAGPTIRVSQAAGAEGSDSSLRLGFVSASTKIPE